MSDEEIVSIPCNIVSNSINVVLSSSNAVDNSSNYVNRVRSQRSFDDQLTPSTSWQSGSRHSTLSRILIMTVLHLSQMCL